MWNDGIMTDSAHRPYSYRTSPDLSVVQRWFQAVVTHPCGIDAGVESQEALELMPMARHDLEQIVTRSEKLSARDRLSIYANAYYARLLDCLGDSYRVLKQTLGGDTFNAFAFGYLQKYPSQSYTLGTLGARFPDYLAETRPDSDDAACPGRQRTACWMDFVIDLARLEWAIAEVFDGPGIEKKDILTDEHLRLITPDEWPSVRLRTVPCLRLLASAFPLNEYYTAARQSPDRPPLPPPSPATSYIAITRRAYIVRRHDLTLAQYILLDALSKGQTLGEAVTLAALSGLPDNEALDKLLRVWFREWMQQELFEAVVPP